MPFLVGRFDGLWDVEGRLHHRAIGATIDGKHAEYLYMVPLRRKDRVGKHRIDDGCVPHQVPRTLRHAFQPVELGASVSKTKVRAERGKVADIVHQDISEALL